MKYSSVPTRAFLLGSYGTVCETNGGKMILEHDSAYGKLINPLPYCFSAPRSLDSCESTFSFSLSSVELLGTHVLAVVNLERTSSTSTTTPHAKDFFSRVAHLWGGAAPFLKYHPTNPQDKFTGHSFRARG